MQDLGRHAGYAAGCIPQQEVSSVDGLYFLTVCIISRQRAFYVYQYVRDVNRCSLCVRSVACREQNEVFSNSR
jgi:hypothetical protein